MYIILLWQKTIWRNEVYWQKTTDYKMFNPTGKHSSASKLNRCYSSELLKMLTLIQLASDCTCILKPFASACEADFAWQPMLVEYLFIYSWQILLTKRVVCRFTTIWWLMKLNVIMNIGNILRESVWWANRHALKYSQSAKFYVVTIVTTNDILSSCTQLSHSSIVNL